MNDTVTALYKNSRYKLITHHDEHYLVDIEQNYWSYIFPIINWFSPMKAYKLSDEEYNAAQQQEAMSNAQQKNRGLFVGGMVVLLSSILRPISYLLELEISDFVNIINAILLILAACCWRYTLRQKNTLDFHAINKESTFIIRPPMKHIFRSLGFYFISLFGIFLFSYIIFTGYSNLIMYGGLLLFSFYLLFSNTTTYIDGPIYVKEIAER
ncbi:DUF443 family protein [Mammaliicoccus sp. Dog046]|uniref:DUF443 family protein n=1 Tax=Mammaliicoccus sp. Dog046 TaxID=3034233 RepID=UPI002B258E8C|nr:DUF443 family protein [Mammaliicoccus sp. Dog046]WQK85567.1 DUF443 family protein [Mammaliicoccus sp. Dog046]